MSPGVQQTNHPDAVRWNKRYRIESAGWLSHPPKNLLLKFAHLLPSRGRALDLASGVGTNSMFLAERGLSPIALDISYVATQIAKERFSQKGLCLNAAVCDLKGLWLPANYFGVVVNFCFLERSTFPAILKSLKPGGLLFFESYFADPQHTSNPGYYLEKGELQDVFSDLEIIHNEQIVRESGQQTSGRNLEQLVARKRRVPKQG